MAEDTMQSFKVMIMVMLFYSFVITILAYVTPSDARNYITSFSDLNSKLDLQSVGEKVEDSLQQQSKIPLIELGALVFYSGNIFVDLMLNFAFAFPEMLGLIVNGIMLLFNIDSYLFAVVQIFASVLMLVFYFLSLMTFLTRVRSSGVV